MLMTSKSKDIIFLIGAGASAEADIPPSGEMIDRIETLLNRDAEWKPYLELYHHIKSAIYYAAGLQGKFKDNVTYNIETVVNTLYELERNEEHPLYPFIAAWNSRLVSLAKGDFSMVREFRRRILRQLKNWVSPDDTSLADYYKGLILLQRGLTFPLRVFSLNYDLCIERLSAGDFRVETGFAGTGPKFHWDWERFEDSKCGPTPPEVYLYKLHGSINWKRDAARNLFCLEQTESIQPENMELIFGRDFKLEAADPYLFYAYEFRKYSLETKVITCIGYGFGDGHINKILTQALKRDDTRRLLIISHFKTDEELKQKSEIISKALDVRPEQVIANKGSAKEFLETADLHSQLLGLIPKPSSAEF
jgi:SIR2-like domain